MTDAQLQALQLDREQAMTAADFFAAYGAHAEDRSRDATDPTQGQLDAASAFRKAGQWAMLFDRARGYSLLVRSALIWHRLGYGFGTYLLTALTPAQVPRADLYIRVRQLVGWHSPDGTVPGADLDDRDEGSAELLAYPQQQAYLALAAAANPTNLGALRERLLTICDAPLHRQGVTPIGSLGTPIQVYWNIARSLLGGDREQAARVVAEHLASMTRVYDGNLRLAMVNEWLWSNAAAPVDAVDVDIMGIARATANRVGPGLLSRELTSQMEELPPIARVAMDIAMQSVADIDRPDIGPPDIDSPDIEPPDIESLDPSDPTQDDWDDPFGL
jgi:hypothetical protein